MPALLIATVAIGTAVSQRVTTTAPRIGRSHADSLSDAFRTAANEVLPTVVQIRSRTVGRRVRQGLPPDLRGFEGFFGRGGSMRIPEKQGTGSGFIIGEDGLILTNNHVVEGADEVIVELADGRQFEASGIRTDPQTDLAVLRIRGAGTLPYARLGDSDAIQIGDWVLAIGNPFQLEASVSAGIISAKGRSIGAAQRASFLQTDAAINPGNSGGPLVNLQGEVIGINSAIKSSSGGYQGIGFAIPANQAKWVVRQLVDEGAVKRAYLGVAVAEVTPDVALTKQIDPRTKGVRVTDLFLDAPAAKAGIQAGDVITHFAGRPIRNGSELQRTVEQLPAGSRQAVRIIRRGQPTEVSVTLDAFSSEEGSSEKSVERDSVQIESATLGLSAAELSRDLNRRLGIPAETTGVLVVEAEPGQIAARSGLSRGLIITAVGTQAVRSMEDLEQALGDVDFERGIPVTVSDLSRGSNREIILRSR